MTDERLWRRIEGKLDALLEKAGVDPAKITGQLPAPEACKLTAEQKDAVANAPETPAAEHPATGMATIPVPETPATVEPAPVYAAPDPETNAPSTVPTVPEEEKAEKKAPVGPTRSVEPEPTEAQRVVQTRK